MNIPDMQRIAVLVASLLAGLAQEAPRPGFEVASIKPHSRPAGDGGLRRVGIDISGPRVRMEALDIYGVIGYAYGLKRHQIFAGPAWAYTDRFDIDAKAAGEGAVTTIQVREMFKTLLSERLRLKFHRETRPMPVYALALAKSGPKLKESPPDATSRLSLRDAGGVSHLTVTKGSMEQLALEFSDANGVERPVLDKTGLTGSYDYQLDCAPGIDTAAAGSGAPSIFTALQEQLGLRLKPQRAPVEILVIDRVEKPGEN